MFKKASVAFRENPLLAIVVVFVIFAVLIIAAVLVWPKGDKYLGTDPASGESVSYGDTGGGPILGPEMLGFSKLLDTDWRLNDVNNIQIIIEHFAYNKLRGVKRISLQTSSIDVSENRLSFNVVVNVDESKYKVTVDKYDVSIDVSIYDSSDQLVFQFNDIWSNGTLSRPAYDRDVSDEFIFNGLATLAQYRTDNWAGGVAATLKLYARSNGIKLERITLAGNRITKDSTGDMLWTQVQTSNFRTTGDLTIEVNVVEKYDVAYIELYDSRSLVFKTTAGWPKNFVIVGDNLPTNTTNINSRDVTLTSEFVPKLDEKLPPLKTGDVVNLYYSCPTSDFQVDACWVYKYDLYY
ncbi:hypothetical protein FWC31_02990 [Candidatus Saccharibacteria bacterium]|nr:hypothetical protein [Candidatus Saccharibacteria bacterium]